MKAYFDKSKSGHTYYTDGSGAIYTFDVDVFRGTAIASYGQSVVLTGIYLLSPRSGNKMYATTAGTYIDLSDSSEKWYDKGIAKNYSQAEAQSYVNKLIANQKQILQNNLLCARYAHKLTTAQKEKLYALQTRLQERNNRLLQDGFVSSVSSSEAYGYQYLDSYLQSFMQAGVGLVVTTTSIVISCVVIASLATAAYFAYKYLYAESAKDVKYSDELTKTLLSKLTPEEYQQLINETKGIVTKASIRARLSATSDVLKYALIAAGGYFVYKFISDRI